MARRLARDSIYLLTGFPIALAAFIMIVTGLSLGIGLLVIAVGIVVLSATGIAARGFATVERTRLDKLLGIPQPAGNYVPPPPDATLPTLAILPLRDLQTWRDMLHAFVHFPIATVTWSIAVTWWSAAIGGLTYVAWGWSIPGLDEPGSQDLPELLGLGGSFIVRVWFYGTMGLIAAVTLPFLMRVLTAIQASISVGLLNSPLERRGKVEALVAGRDATRAAEQHSLRRLERDIHDGPQQRLVRLSMDLGRAQKKAEGDAPELALALNDARQQTQDTLDELRALSRGIAPPILADRGLHRALEELTARSAVPATSAIDLADSALEPHVETAVYFVASEALTNVAKHSSATEALLLVDAAEQEVIVAVRDDGDGGAHFLSGHGLEGLAERMRSVDGSLIVDSPNGGPTTVTARIPTAV